MANIPQSLNDGIPQNCRSNAPNNYTLMSSDFELHNSPRAELGQNGNRDADHADHASNRHIRCGSSVRLLRLAQVMQQTGLRKTKLYQLQATGSFPMRIQFTSTSVGWIEHEVRQWILQRVTASQPLRRK